MTTVAHPAETDIDLLGHLYRRAGFGATREQLESYAKLSYEDTVEALLNPDPKRDIQDDVLERYIHGEGPPIFVAGWLYRMINSEAQLQEKMTLFWHHVFATGLVKNEHVLAAKNQIKMFRRNGMGDMTTILNDLSRDPAMLFWLDNNENRNGEPNENYGRELLELFSLGVGNYSELDIKDASRAFTGWTFEQPPPLYPHGYYPAKFLFREDDHDDGEKTFLGVTGNLNGGDIIDIIVKSPASARFICRHLYNFFVADEPQVPSWNDVPPLDPDGIAMMEATFIETGGDIRSVLRVMFNSDFFKAARYKKVKSPTEFIVGVLKMVGSQTEMAPGMTKYAGAIDVMGQKLLDPPTVEGWHTGGEWIDGGNLTERVNFAVDEIGEGLAPGIQTLVQRIKDSESLGSAESLVNAVLTETGYVEVSDRTREALIDFANDAEGEDQNTRVIRLLRLAVATPEYQFA
ncbi:MAG: DUF1800 domain-containing protein [Dehalococcoidia bacterium]|nr:DUF1800 domain-containing protein [Dehalococcoidia bacterium]